MERRYQIEQLAFELYENSGRAEGRNLENWLEAERLIMKGKAHAAEDENQTAEETSDSIIEEELQEV